MPLTYSEEMRLTEHFLDALRLRLTDKVTDTLPAGGVLYERIDPSQQCLLGCIGPVPDPTFHGPQPPSAMGMVLRVSPDEQSRVVCNVSGQFDIAHRAMPSLAVMRESLIMEANGLKRDQQIAVAYQRYTVQFDGARLVFDTDALGQWMTDDGVVQAQIQTLEQQCLAGPTTFRQCQVNAQGNAQFHFVWDDQQITDQASFEQAVERAIFVDTTRVAPFHVRVRGRLRSIPPAFRAGPNHYLVEIFLENQTLTDATKPFGLERPSLLDVQFDVALEQGTHHMVPHRLRPEDYQYLAEDGVPGYGITCGVDQIDASRFRTNSLPRVAQPRVEAPRPQDVGMADHPPTYASLANDPFPVLSAFLVSLDAYGVTWDATIAALDPITQKAEITEARAGRSSFDAERARIADGVGLLRRKPDLARCFQWMNEVMDRAVTLQKKAFKGWHLFQLGFILSQVRAIYERHPDAGEAQASPASADHADVLWFATGGGKTEAYLGIVAIAMLYGRRRERQYGCTAWMRFPLRMLSVQQFQRLSYVVAQANIVREREELGGHPFTIGYFTGAGTPNAISSDAAYAQATFLPNLSPERAAEFQFIRDCPYCGEERSIRLTMDFERARLKHVCSAPECWSNIGAGDGTHGEGIRGEIGIYVSDEECYRYLPSVMVGTIDKLAVVATNKRFAGFYGAFKHFCPEHGFSASAKCTHARVRRKATGEYESLDCGNNSRTSAVRTSVRPALRDPGFSFLIQDELHLLKESLGNFDAHYETLINALQRAYGGMSPKVLAATATIKDLDDHIHHLYLKNACRFPAPGATRGESFYARRARDPVTLAPLVRRWFAGMLPIGRGNITMRSVAEISARFLDQVDAWCAALRAGDPTLLAQLALPAGRAGEALSYIERNLNTDLMYCNRKRNITEVLRFTEEANTRRGVVRDIRQLDAETSLEQIMETIRHIETKTPEHALRQVIATSVVSHGIDIAELNFMIMAGWPSSTAEYIQASARSGRVHPGIVIAVLSSRNLFESNIFLSFADYHFFLEKLVDSVPINRFAPNILDRTLPGIMGALLINLAPHAAAWGADLDFHVKSVYKALLSTGQARIDLERWALQALAVPVAMQSTFDARILQDFEEALRKRVANALHRLEHWSAGKMDQSIPDALGDIFGHNPMRSFRDIEDQIEIKAVNGQADRILAALSR